MTDNQKFAIGGLLAIACLGGAFSIQKYIKNKQPIPQILEGDPLTIEEILKTYSDDFANSKTI
jgi:hypothetical protein